MGVYIKNMEMPQNCEECDVKVVCKNYWKFIREKYTRPSWCPLILVSPHGRLIDADALIKLDRMIGKMMMFGGEYVYTQAEIDRAPTILPAEEGEGGMKIGITRLTRMDKDGKIREYVPCKRNDDRAEGFICPETGDFICIRPTEEDEI